MWDFLFRYYSLRPRQLRVWHPGFGVVLGGAAARRYLDRTGYGRHPARRDGDLRASAVPRRHRAVHRGSVARHGEPLPRLNCFGLHEWAMVYRAPTVRHEQVPLRLGAAATDAVVESIPLRCTHFDAFRFFTAPAAARNAEPLTPRAQSRWEQPGCMHANMDLYKWCYKLGPLVDSELLLDCLELAADARELDMRASPYDLAGYGFEPIAIETPAGRADYVRAPAATSPTGRRRCGPRLAERCDDCCVAAVTLRQCSAATGGYT